eukprot:TRINITY_DN9769_c0_g1_i2.p1 TRINITY_DN9769_c0_g1~~TRINITY_DN9769_c0_g1_i2.p1  ORF type:complete len:347 (-),score=70.36 TRINITY_DN9769_c0_g1_i2:954-1994(-)
MASEGAEDVEYEVVADSSVTDLGITLEGLPPGYLKIEAVAKGGWAESESIRVGDALLEVNGVDLEGMAADRYEQEIQIRPLKLMLVEGASISGQSQAQVSGDETAKLKQDQEETEKQSPATQEKQPTADENTLAAPPHEYLRGRSTSLHFRRRSQERGSEVNATGGTEDEEYEVVADTGVTELGIAFEGLPPGYLQIKELTKGGWGESNSIRVGDLLLEVNGVDLEDMAADRYKQELEVRPLNLVLVRSEDMEYEVVAESSVIDLGITLKGAPPGYLKIQAVANGGWGESKSIRMGDLLVEVNGVDLEGMAADRYEQELKERPLKLVLVEGASISGRSQAQPESST